DGRRFNGRTVGLDSRVDLALLRIDAGGLPVLPIGDSNRMRVGEFVLALGHPFGLEQSVSFGIVSRKGMPLTVAAPGFDFIQTDAAINPGNSGGPLVNMAGQVIGVNSMAARNGSIGFAIPSNLVKLLVPQLVAKGKVEWGWLGVSITEVTEEDVPRLKLREARGVLVRGVMPGEPAAVGGVKADDVLVAVDGTRLENPPDLQRVVASTPVGSRAPLVHVAAASRVALPVGRGALRDGFDAAQEVAQPRLLGARHLQRAVDGARLHVRDPVGLQDQQRPRVALGEVARARAARLDHEPHRAGVVGADFQVTEEHGVRPARAVDRDERQRHPEAGGQVALREAVDERRRQPRTERASHVREGSTVGRPTLTTPRAARAARSDPGPTPPPRNVTPAAVVLALHLRRDAVRIGPGLDGWRAADGTSSVVVAPALRGHVLDFR